jgi:hypothetical protein
VRSATARVEQPVRSLLVVGETIAGPAVEEAVRFAAAAGPVRALVLSAGGGATGARRVEAAVTRLREAGVEARGAVGAADPLQAMEDALRFFPADEIVISTRPHGHSRWLDRDVAGRAWERFRLPLVHAVGEADQAT